MRYDRLVSSFARDHETCSRKAAGPLRACPASAARTPSPVSDNQSERERFLSVTHLVCEREKERGRAQEREIRYDRPFACWPGISSTNALSWCGAWRECLRFIGKWLECRVTCASMLWKCMSGGEGVCRTEKCQIQFLSVNFPNRSEERVCAWITNTKRASPHHTLDVRCPNPPP